MQYPVKDIVDFMENWAKNSYQLSWDNSGKQIFFEEMTNSIIIGMDVTDKLIKEAINSNSKLIITHHPLFFGEIKNIIKGTYSGDNIINLLENKISVFSAHTSLDIAQGGVNDSLFNKLLLKDREILAFEEEKPMGLVGTLKEPMKFKDFLQNISTELNIKNTKSYGKNPYKKIRKVALMGGAGSLFINNAKNIADVYLTGDVKYHEGQWAYENDFIVVDLGHFHSEKFVLEEIKNRILIEFPNLDMKICENSSFELD